MISLFSQHSSTQLRTHFSRTRYLQSREGIIEFAVKTKSCWIIARELLLFHTLTLDNIPAQHREKILQQQLIRWSPFARTGSYYVLVNEKVQNKVAGKHSTQISVKALVWLWDATLQQSMQTQHFQHSKAKPARAMAAIPETVFYPQHAKGWLIQPCQRGYDIQYWQNETLYASIWLDHKPGKAELLFFARQYVNNELSEPEEPEQKQKISAQHWLKRPWSEHSAAAFNQLLAPQLVIKLLFSGLLAWGAFEVGNLLALQQYEQNLQVQIEQLNETLTQPLKLRSKTSQLKMENEVLFELFKQTKLLAILSEFDKQLPFKLLKPLQLDYQPGQLIILVEDIQIDNREYVEKLSASPMFEQVQLEPGLTENQLKISLQIISPPRPLELSPGELSPVD